MPTSNNTAPHRLHPLEPVPQDSDAVLTTLRAAREALNESTPDQHQRHTNTGYAIKAACALKGYLEADHAALEPNTSPEQDHLDTIRDLLNDLHHLCDALGLDWDQAVRQYHYDDEVAFEQ